MQAVVLAAGRGSRMGSLTEHQPKPLVSLGGSSIISHCIDSLPSEISECIVVVGYSGIKQ